MYCYLDAWINPHGIVNNPYGNQPTNQPTNQQKNPLAFWKKSYEKPWQQHIKCRDIILQTNVHIVKAMVFPVAMYGCGSWTVKKAEEWRIDAF